MKTLKDEIIEFVTWAFTDPTQQFYREAFTRMSDATFVEQVDEQFDEYRRLIAVLGPAVCRERVRQLVDAAREHCSGAPIPSDEALAALFSDNPRLYLERSAPSLAG